MSYPPTRHLPLPSNVEDIAGSEKARFSPLRSRDINGSLIAGDVSRPSGDLRISCYDSNGSVSLNSAMQSNVPQPCREQGLYTHFNMPGGLWRQGEKYIAADYVMSSTLNRHFSSKPEVEEKAPTSTSGYATLSRKEKLKTAVKEYGSVVIVFHVGISLVSLGICYLAVTRWCSISLSFVCLFCSCSRKPYQYHSRRILSQIFLECFLCFFLPAMLMSSWCFVRKVTLMPQHFGECRCFRSRKEIGQFSSAHSHTLPMLPRWIEVVGTNRSFTMKRGNRFGIGIWVIFLSCLLKVNIFLFSVGLTSPRYWTGGSLRMEPPQLLQLLHLLWRTQSIKYSHLYASV